MIFLAICDTIRPCHAAARMRSDDLWRAKRSVLRGNKETGCPPEVPRCVLLAATHAASSHWPPLALCAVLCYWLRPASQRTRRRLQVVLLNGGGQPPVNFYSHLLRETVQRCLAPRRGLPTDITIFNADGVDPQADFAVRELQPEADFWLPGTRLERPLRTQIRYENSVVDSFTPQPATRAALRHWFEEAAERLRPSDTLLFYVTDHGTKNAEDLGNNRITLWGDQSPCR